MRIDWKSYFVFTKRERIGVVVLVFLIVMVAVLPLFFSEPENDIDKLELEKFRKELAMAENRSDKSGVEDSLDENRDENRGNFSDNKEEFLFDPNKLSEIGWKRLGIRDRTIQTIHRFLDKGGQFRNPEDIGRIYGISKTDYNRLLPFVRIENEKKKDSDVGGNNQFAHRKEYSEKSKYEEKTYEERNPKKKIPLAAIEINSADSTAFMALPGIGRVLATRIIRFREKLGGYYQVDQIKEVYGMSDSTFQLVRSAFICNAGGIRKINLNSCEQSELSKHPYIQYKLAAFIIQYRTQHGRFHNLSDLLKIETVDAHKVQKLEPYLTIE